MCFLDQFRTLSAILLFAAMIPMALPTSVMGSDCQELALIAKADVDDDDRHASSEIPLSTSYSTDVGVLPAHFDSIDLGDPNDWNEVVLCQLRSRGPPVRRV